MENMVNYNQNINSYSGKKVFITGHTGFKGSWLSCILSELGAIVKGYSLAPETSPSLYSTIENSLNIESIISDINDSKKLESEIINFDPDYVFHLAAQPLVRKSYEEPLNTFNTNIIGTANLLNSLINLKKKCNIILITTDKVYQNKEWIYPYREDDELGGYDPYSSSKAASEIVINSFRKSFFNLEKFSVHQKAIASVRAGNVIGGGDWSQDRLLPDIIKAIYSNEDIIIRNPNSIRPWQHVIEPIYGYLTLGLMLNKDAFRFSGSWNFGPLLSDNISVLSIANLAVKILDKGKIIIKEDINNHHEAKLLKLDISKAINELNWTPRVSTIESVRLTIEWYKDFYEKNLNPYFLMKRDYEFYKKLMDAK